MRPLLALTLLTLAACAGPLPAPDPQQAWVTMDSKGTDTLMAHERDGSPVNDGRYFQVTPGAHELLVRYSFDVNSGAKGFSDPSTMTCHLRFKYDGFAAGRHYRVEARAMQYKARGWLYDEQRQVLARAQLVRCSNLL